MVVKKVRVARSSFPNQVRINIESVTNNGNGTLTYNFTKPHKLLQNYVTNITNTIPSEFNQSNAKILSVSNEGSSFTITKTVTSSYISGGYIEIPITPETDTYLVRYRIVNKKNETSQWSPLFGIINNHEDDVNFNYFDGGEES